MADPSPVAHAPTFWSAFSPSIPFIVGGLLTMGGSIATAITSHFLKAKTDSNQRRREKLEEVGTLVCELEHWMHSYQSHLMFDEEAPGGPPPLPRVEMLVAAYFPNLKVSLSKLVIATHEYVMWLAGGVQHKTSLTSGFGDEYTAGLTEKYEPFECARGTFLECLGQEMKTIG